MTVITRGGEPRLMRPGLDKVWGLSYKEYESEWSKLYEVTTSSMNYEEDQQMTGFGTAPEKLEGGSVAYAATSQGYPTRYTHRTYALGYIITREDIEDNLYIKKGMQRTKNLKFVMLQTKERIGILPFDRAFSNTYAIGDGVALISTSHPTAAGNRSNRLSYDADLSELVLEQSMIDIMDFRDNAGNNTNHKAH